MKNIARSRHVQGRVRWCGAAGGIATLLLLLFGSWLTLPVLVSTVFIVGMGYYITGMHILEWKQELHQLEKESSS